MVGGYDVFKALDRAQQEASKRKRPTRAAPESEEPAVKKVASHIGHTAMPPKHKLVCFECGYAFEIAGRIDSILCPRCRVDISLRDEKIEGDWSGDLKTGGIVEIGENGVVRDGVIIAKEIILNGRIAGGEVNAYHRLILGRHGEYNEDLLQTPNLRVAEQSRIILERGHTFKTIDIAGEMRAEDLVVDELLTINAGGFFKGSAKAARMLVESGGGLWAIVAVSGSENL